MTKESLTKGKLRASIFAGVFGLICILLTMFVGYTFSIEIVESTMGMIMTIITLLIMWMVYVGTYILLLVLADLDEKSTA